MGHDERVEVGGPGKHPGEIGYREQCGCAVLDPLDLRSCLTVGAVAMATGVVRVPLKPTGETPCGVSTALRGTADLAVTHPLLMGGGHRMGTAVRFAVETEDSGDFPRGGLGVRTAVPGRQAGACGDTALRRRGQGRVPAG